MIQNEWTIEYCIDRAKKIELLRPGEFNYSKDLCLKAVKNFKDYLDQEINYDPNNKCSTAVLINGELRFPVTFLKWLQKISKFLPVYLFTDFCKYSQIDLSIRHKIEGLLSDIAFSEDYSDYKKYVSRPWFQPNMHQWLKFKLCCERWENLWREMGIETIFRARSDIAFLNPYLLEFNLKNNFSDFLNESCIVARSDQLFAFNIILLPVLKKVFDYSHELFLSKDWMSYPYLPIHPDHILGARGATRVEWNLFPIQYIGTQPSYDSFFENIAMNYQIISEDYEYFKIGMLADERKKIFGNKLYSSRNQPINRFTSERHFAYYLAMMNITAKPHGGLFDGLIIRDVFNYFK